MTTRCRKLPKCINLFFKPNSQHNLKYQYTVYQLIELREYMTWVIYVAFKVCTPIYLLPEIWTIYLPRGGTERFVYLKNPSNFQVFIFFTLGLSYVRHHLYIPPPVKTSRGFIYDNVMWEINHRPTDLSIFNFCFINNS